MKIAKSKLARMIQEEISKVLREEDKPLTNMAKDIEDAGTEGDFREWCQSPEGGGHESANQACVDAAAKKGGRPAKQAAEAVAFSHAKGGAKSMTYPKKKEDK